MTIERWEPTPGRASFVARLEGRDPSAPSLCLMGHTDVVPVHADGWHARPVRRRAGRATPTASTRSGAAAPSTCSTSRRRWPSPSGPRRPRRPAARRPALLRRRRRGGRQRPRRPLGRRPPPRRHPLRLRAHRERRPARRLAGGAGDRRDGRREGRGLAPAARPRDAGPRLDAVPHRQRARQGGRRRAATRRVPAGAAVPRAVAGARRVAARARRAQGGAARPAARSTTSSTTLPNAAAAAHLHACTHTTFSPNLIDGGVMKTNVIPDSITLDVDVRTLPGEGTDEVDGPPAGRARRPRRPRRGRDPARRPGVDQPHRHAAVGRAAAGRRRCRSPAPGCRRSSRSASPTPACSASSARSPTAPGCSARRVDAAEFGRRFHGHDERVDVESLGLTVELWQRVIADLLSCGQTPTSIGSAGRRRRARSASSVGQPARGEHDARRRRRRARRASTSAARAPARRAAAPTSGVGCGSKAAACAPGRRGRAGRPSGRR